MLLPLRTPFPLSLSRTRIKAIALEVAPCSVRMQGPVLHADPAELVTALATAHVIASFIFLYSGRAAGTFLSVGCYPQSIGKMLSRLYINIIINIRGSIHVI